MTGPMAFGLFIGLPIVLFSNKEWLLVLVMAAASVSCLRLWWREMF
jgi:hypothetical protein